MLIIHSSRSRYEAYNKCMRFGFLQYNWGGRGIVKIGKNIFFMTGGWLHKGLELIGLYLKNTKGAQTVPEQTLDWIIQKVKEGYFAELFPPNWQENVGGFDLSNETLDEEGNKRELTEYETRLRQQYTFDEQTALIDGLLRVFVLRVVPSWMAKYKIVSIELDMSFPLVSGEGWEVIQSARIDWVLQEIESKDLFLVSFKGYRQFGEHEAKVASHDTQGLSESWAFDEYLKTKKIEKRIMGVRMLYLIKGARKETKRGNRNYEQQSPLIRGYRKLTEDGPEYAHSWFYPDTRDEDQRNDSGVRALGRSWEKFDVFNGEGLREVGGVKGWLGLLDNGSVQEDCGDILEEQVKEPEIYMRHDRDIESWLRQTKGRETEIAFKLSLEESYIANQREDEYLDDCFPQNRAACFYYPNQVNECPYLSVCFGTEEERNNPLENGYEWRTPHHKAELIQIQGMKC